jgi:hypothetical protein
MRSWPAMVRTHCCRAAPGARVLSGTSQNETVRPCSPMRTPDIGRVRPFQVWRRGSLQDNLEALPLRGEGRYRVDVLDDVADLRRAAAEPLERRRHRLVDDFHQPAAHQLLLPHEGDVPFDVGRVAVHHEADGAVSASTVAWRVAEAAGLAQFDHRLARRRPGPRSGHRPYTVTAVAARIRHSALIGAVCPPAQRGTKSPSRALSP